MKISKAPIFSLLLLGLMACATGRYVIPKPLVDGDLVGVVSISSRNAVDADTAYARTELAKLGFRTLFSEHLLDQDDPSFGASDSVRAADLMKMVRNDSVRAVLFYRGGYGAVRTLDGIDWRDVRRHSKWIVGYSDITIFHLACAARGIPTIHGDMPVTFDRDTILVADTSVSTSLRSLAKVLRGELTSIRVEPHPFNQCGEARGRVVGGNLSIIYAAGGTPEDKAFDKKGYVLFIEEVGEKLYHVDRMMQNLERSGKLARASAIVVGQMMGITHLERFEVDSAEELIARYTSKYKIPVIFGMPSGHGRPNLSFYMGCRAKVEVQPNGARIEFLAH